MSVSPAEPPALVRLRAAMNDMKLCVACDEKASGLMKSAGDAAEQAHHELQLTREALAVLRGTADRRHKYESDAIVALLDDVTNLRVARGEAEEGPLRHRALFHHTLAAATDDANAARVVEMLKVNSDLTVERNRLLAEVNRLKTAHGRELDDMRNAHAKQVAELERKLGHLNDVVMHCSGANIVKRMREHTKELFELKEALFVMREEVRKTKLFMRTAQPLSQLQEAFAQLAASRDGALRDRDAALSFVQRVRVAFSDLWRNSPIREVGELRKDLGRRDDATNLVAAVRVLTDKYTTLIQSKMETQPCAATQCHLLCVATPKAVISVGVATPIEWQQPAARRPSVARSMRNSRHQSLVASPPALSSGAPPSPSVGGGGARAASTQSGSASEQSFAAQRLPAPQEADLADEGSVAVLDVESSMGGVAFSDGGSTGDGTEEEEEHEDEVAEEAVPQPLFAPGDTDAMWAAVDKFRSFRLQRAALATWLQRFHRRQVVRLEKLVVQKIDTMNPRRTQRKAPCPPPSDKRALGTAAVVATAVTARRTNSTPAPLAADSFRSARLGEAIVVSGTVAHHHPRPDSRPVSARSRPDSASRGPRAMSTLSVSDASADAALAVLTVPSALSGDEHVPTLTVKRELAPRLHQEFGGGWRYGHLRTVVPMHAPSVRVPSAASSTDFVTDAVAMLQATTPRCNLIVSMVTAQEHLRPRPPATSSTNATTNADAAGHV